jgi:hypothetical protein
VNAARELRAQLSDGRPGMARPDRVSMRSCSLSIAQLSGVERVWRLQSRSYDSGVDKFLLRLFQSEVVSQCEFGLRAWRDLGAALEDSQRQFEKVRTTPPEMRRPEVRYKTITMDDVPPGSVLSDHTIAEIQAGRFRMPIYEPIDAQAMVAEAMDRAWETMRPTTDTWYAVQNLLIACGNLSKLLWGKKSQAASRKDLRDSLGMSDDSPLRDRTVRGYFEHFDEKLEGWYAQSERRNFVGRNIGPANMIQGLSEAERFHHFDPTTGSVTFTDKSVSLAALIAEIDRIRPIARTESLKWMAE